jgi:hypothetical protein
MELAPILASENPLCGTMRDTSALSSRNRHRYLRREQNMNDIVERLRHHTGSMFGGWLMVQAADEIERLRAEVEAWKERWEAERRDHEATIPALRQADEGGA